MANQFYIHTAVRIRDLTTTSGEDYSERYAKQIQFNPGEFEKTWRLQLTDDDQYEVKVCGRFVCLFWFFNC